LSVNKIGH